MASFNLFPARCYSCGKTLSSKQLEYEKLIREGMGTGDAMDKLGITKYCCRSRIIGNKTIIFGSQDTFLTNEQDSIEQLEQSFSKSLIQPPRSTSLSGALNALQNPVGISQTSSQSNRPSVPQLNNSTLSQYNTNVIQSSASIPSLSNPLLPTSGEYF